MSQAPPTPPWIARQAHRLLQQRGHAWLLQGPAGLGQYGLAMALARAWLCDNPGEGGACGQCGSCHAIDVRTHADLCVLMPETWMLDLGWPLSEKAQSDLDDKNRKPSKEIRVEAMRDALEFCQRTSARGRGKAVLVYPVEDMNAFTANALLKTLEEPPGDVRFVLATESSHQLLPTLRSRCMGHTMAWPEAEESLRWLQSAGLSDADAQKALTANAGRPQEALQWVHAGRDPAHWAAFPGAMARGDVQLVREWTVQELLGALQKLCYDMLARAVQAEPRFFSAQDLGPQVSLSVLTQWSQSLAAQRRTMDHPFNAGLFTEALVCDAQAALTSRSN